MILTILRTPVAYAVTVLLVMGAILAAAWTGNTLVASAAAKQLAGGGTWGGVLLAKILGAGLSVYCDLVALRAVGLYYRHFRSRFAWDWG
jgi:hypothetical protein